jgi:hypothetical protein
MESNSPYSSPEQVEDIDAFLKKYTPSATNVLKCKTGQAGIVRFLQHVEGYSEDDARRLSYPLFDVARRKIRRTQIPKAIFGIFLITVSIIGPLFTWFVLGFVFWFMVILPFIAGGALLASVNRPQPLES